MAWGRDPVWASLVAQWQRIDLQSRRFRRCGFDPWVRKIPWKKAWRPIPVFLPGKSHGLRSLVGYSPWGCKELDTTEVTEHACMQRSKLICYICINNCFKNIFWKCIFPKIHFSHTDLKIHFHHISSLLMCMGLVFCFTQVVSLCQFYTL